MTFIGSLLGVSVVTGLAHSTGFLVREQIHVDPIALGWLHRILKSPFAAFVGASAGRFTPSGIDYAPEQGIRMGCLVKFETEYEVDCLRISFHWFNDEDEHASAAVSPDLGSLRGALIRCSLV